MPFSENTNLSAITVGSRVLVVPKSIPIALRTESLPVGDYEEIPSLLSVLMTFLKRLKRLFPLSGYVSVLH